MFLMSAMLYVFSYAAVPVDNYFNPERANVRAVYSKIISANKIYNAPKLVFNDSETINASAYGNTININRGLIRVVNKDSLALVLGHEVAHTRLGHRGSTPNNEYAADKLGAHYMKNAGYNVCHGAKFLRGLKGGDTHPEGQDRYRALGCR